MAPQKHIEFPAPASQARHLPTCTYMVQCGITNETFVAIWSVRDGKWYRLASPFEEIAFGDRPLDRILAKTSLPPNQWYFSRQQDWRDKRDIEALVRHGR